MYGSSSARHIDASICIGVAWSANATLNSVDERVELRRQVRVAGRRCRPATPAPARPRPAAAPCPTASSGRRSPSRGGTPRAPHRPGIVPSRTFGAAAARARSRRPPSTSRRPIPRRRSVGADVNRLDLGREHADQPVAGRCDRELVRRRRDASHGIAMPARVGAPGERARRARRPRPARPAAARSLGGQPPDDDVASPRRRCQPAVPSRALA